MCLLSARGKNKDLIFAPEIHQTIPDIASEVVTGSCRSFYLHMCSVCTKSQFLVLGCFPKVCWAGNCGCDLAVQK